MKVYSENTFAEAFTKIIYDLVHVPEFVCSPRDQKIKENINVSIEIKNPKFCLFTNEFRSSPMKYIAHELLLYFSGTRSGELFCEASPFWKRVLNNDNTINSAYGNLVFETHYKMLHSQFEWAYYSLLADKDTRQAIMHYNMPKHQVFGTKDFVCTLSNQFFIRDNKLSLIYTMRSNDVHFGLPIDVVWGYVLMETMRKKLQYKYQNLELGSYYHNTGSLHMYSRNFEVYENIVNSGDVLKPEKFPFEFESSLSDWRNDCLHVVKNKVYTGNNNDLIQLTKLAFGE